MNINIISIIYNILVSSHYALGLVRSLSNAYPLEFEEAKAYLEMLDDDCTSDL